MKNLKSIMCILSMITLVVGILLGCAYGQTAPDNYLKMKGKVLDGYTADITVYQENDNEGWDLVRTMKSRKNYSLKLNPESNYYILFESPDGLNKVLYVDAGSTGMWIMQLDINFYSRNIKYARMYQHASKDYAFKVVHKDKSKIVIGTASTEVNETFFSRLNE
jgi:hypothetical protein